MFSSTDIVKFNDINYFNPGSSGIGGTDPEGTQRVSDPYHTSSLEYEVCTTSTVAPCLEFRVT